jgi:hypothetical protein
VDLQQYVQQPGSFVCQLNHIFSSPAGLGLAIGVVIAVGLLLFFQLRNSVVDFRQFSSDPSFAFAKFFMLQTMSKSVSFLRKNQDLDPESFFKL